MAHDIRVCCPLPNVTRQWKGPFSRRTPHEMRVWSIVSTKDSTRAYTNHLQAVLRQMSILWCEPTPRPEIRNAASCTSPTRRCRNGGGRAARNVGKHVESIRCSVSPPHEEEPEAALGQQTGKHIIEHNTPSTWEQFQTGPWLGNIE